MISTHNRPVWSTWSCCLPGMFSCLLLSASLFPGATAQLFLPKLKEAHGINMPVDIEFQLTVNTRQYSVTVASRTLSERDVNDIESIEVIPAVKGFSLIFRATDGHVISALEYRFREKDIALKTLSLVRNLDLSPRSLLSHMLSSTRNLLCKERRHLGIGEARRLYLCDAREAVPLEKIVGKSDSYQYMVHLDTSYIYNHVLRTVDGDRSTGSPNGCPPVINYLTQLLIIIGIVAVVSCLQS